MTIDKTQLTYKYVRCRKLMFYFSICNIHCSIFHLVDLEILSQSKKNRVFLRLFRCENETFKFANTSHYYSFKSKVFSPFC